MLTMLPYQNTTSPTTRRRTNGSACLPLPIVPSTRLTVSSLPDFQHHIFYLSLDGRLGLAPPNLPGASVGRVLDLGTGTGIWAMDFGDEHPEAEVGSFPPTDARYQTD